MKNNSALIATIHPTYMYDTAWVHVYDGVETVQVYEMHAGETKQIMEKPRVMFSVNEDFDYDGVVYIDGDKSTEKRIWWGRPGAVNWDGVTQKYRLRSSTEYHMDDACMSTGIHSLWGKIDCVSWEEFKRLLDSDDEPLEVQIIIDRTDSIPAIIKHNSVHDLRVIVDDSDVGYLEIEEVVTFLEGLEVKYKEHLKSNKGGES